MTKQELITKIEQKKGFISFIGEERIAPDNDKESNIEKKYFLVNHENSDGTAGQKFVFFLEDKETHDAWFYNLEEELDNQEPNVYIKKLNKLEEYLDDTFHSYFIIRTDLKQGIGEADVYTLTDGKLSASRVLVFKEEQSIKHLSIV